MISLDQRTHTALIINEAIEAGCGVAKACNEAGIDRRTFRRWTASGVACVSADARPEADRPVPSNRLPDELRADVLASCQEPRFADMPPSQIVPVLADEGIYLASESTYYRVLHAWNEQFERGRARARSSHTLSTHCATGPNELWCWDVTYLGSPTRGLYYYLYMIMDVWSRKIVGFEVYASETGDLAAQLFERTVLAEACVGKGVILHADNGAPQRSSTLRAKLDQLGLRTSYSRPRVSNDNAYSESLFRTTKYRHNFPTEGFKTIEDARVWVLDFVRWYNTEHRHSAIRFVTPSQRHEGKDIQILANRHQLYEQAKERNPERWSGETRNWERPEEVWLNPKTKTDKIDQKLKEAA